MANVVVRDIACSAVLEFSYGKFNKRTLAFGSGSILSTAAQYFFNERSKRKTFLFQEKKEAFVGLLDAYYKAAVDPSEKSSKEFAYWQIRCELICSEKTKKSIQNIIDTNENKKDRFQAHNTWKECLSDELIDIFEKKIIRSCVFNLLQRTIYKNKARKAYQ